jgi:NADH:ubiquinone oxidoreductase subunit 5 (subunit L)/multisubunit Na+/H+ antiporter MnhA subunit
MDLSGIPNLLLFAWLAPLASFVLIVFFGPRLGKHGVFAGHVATGAIVIGLVLSLTSLVIWSQKTELPPHHGHAAADGAHSKDSHSKDSHSKDSHSPGAHKEEPYEKPYLAGDWYEVSPPGMSQKITVGYYIDALTIAMFVVVTLIASCIHFYSMGYMHEELHDVTDHEVTLADGHHLHRPGRYYRFFQYMSLFCFSMLGLVIAGNIAMVFVFWELVGICSYFLIGFYIERKSASNAANKAFIVNRVGDFGMIIGLMALWGSLGTFAFGDKQTKNDEGELVVARNAHGEIAEPGIFSRVRSGEHHQIETPLEMVRQDLVERKAEIKRYLVPDLSRKFDESSFDAQYDELQQWESQRAAWKRKNDEWVAENESWLMKVRTSAAVPEVPRERPVWTAKTKAAWGTAWSAEKTRRAEALVGQAIEERFGDQKELRLLAQGNAPGDPVRYGYWLLVLAGIGIFCGCVGKSAQFPLHVWLPDAMEGPTPVSALVHSATMVAAGVYLVGRFYPVFTPEVLLVIAIVGAITLFLAATIAITAVDIKRVLAYSTVSQLGYMMLALGLGGWIAGLFHLITHAFFKSLLFLCSGSVIHACHTNDMRKMGGLLSKMPWTGYTMLVGCLAIIGAGIPFVVGLSGYYSKDAILAQAFTFGEANPSLWFFFPLAAAGAAITAFYMFRLWFMTFVGKPRDHHVHEHVHESPPTMYVPLLVLAFFAVAIGWNRLFGVPALLEQAQPEGIGHAGAGHSSLWMALDYPAEHAPHHSGGTPAQEKAHFVATGAAFGTALFGVLLAGLMYWGSFLNPSDVRAYFSPIYRLLWNKWYFDEIYWTLFVRPTLFLSRLIAKFDRRVIDWVIDGSAKLTVRVARLDDQIIDRTFVDGLVNLTAAWIYSLGIWLRRFQTGRLRQYVTFIVVGTVALFVLIGFWSKG